MRKFNVHQPNIDERHQTPELYLISRRSDAWTSQKQIIVYAMSPMTVQVALYYQSDLAASLIGACMVLVLNAIDAPRSFTAKQYLFTSLLMVRHFF